MRGRVVIIDASLTVRMDLGEAFQEAGFDVVLCSNGQEARAVLAQQPPELIILDVLLPDADGVELLIEFRNTPATARTIILLLSSEAEIKDRVRGLIQGANEYVGKPYDTAYVVARANELLQLAAPPSAKQPCILLIDDSITYRQELGELLREAGYGVILAASGEEGLRRAAELHPDAILVDGFMPELDGTAFIRRIRLDPDLRVTPCLLLTAAQGSSSEVLALDAGADTYVCKLDGTDVVLARLGAMLRTSRETRERASSKSQLTARRLLAVDDSVTYLEEVCEQLSADGYDVLKATSGEEALKLLGLEKVDCILLDLMMPVLSGTETCRRIKGSPLLRNIPLIMLTALSEQDSMLEGINAGADDYVTKSANFDVLKARLRSQLRRKQFEEENRRSREEILRKDAEAHLAREIAETRGTLLRSLEEKNATLLALNKELEVFAYSISHDLRQPLRSISGFSNALLEDYGELLDLTAKRYLDRVQEGVQRMNQQIEGLLTLSHVTRVELRKVPLNLASIAQRVFERLHDMEPSRDIEFIIPASLPAFADPRLIESVLENLLGNAWKFTSKQKHARIQLGIEASKEASIYFVDDNGAGFKMEYADKLFGPFQRLHSEQEFPGMGIGLSTVQRIIHRHGGKIWAKSAPNQGTTFYFTLANLVEPEPSAGKPLN